MAAPAETLAEPLALRADSNGVATLTLNRPAARNALSSALMAELQDALEALRGDAEAKVVVIAGAGPAFCAGHDLKEVRGLGPAAHPALFAQCSRLMTTIVHFPKPRHRPGPRDRHRGGLPAGRLLRPRGGGGGRPGSPRRGSISACSARRRWWR